MTNRIEFSPHGPARGEYYFGRKNLVAYLETMLLQGGNVILVGERRIGKTSTLIQVGDRVSVNSESGITSAGPILIHVGPYIRSTDDFLDYITKELLTWSETQNNHLAREITRVLRSQTDRHDLFKSLKRLREADQRLLLLIDDVDSTLIQDPHLPYVLRAIVSEDHVTALTTSFREPHKMQSDTLAASPWFSVFLVRTLGLFDDSEALEMLLALSTRSGRQFTRPECRLLMEVFGNFPFYLQLAGFLVFSHGQFATASSRRRRQVIQESLMEASEQLARLFPYMLNHLSRDELTTLVAIANGEAAKLDVDALQHCGYLESRGFIVWPFPQTFQPRIFSQVFEEYLKGLPQDILLHENKRSTFWESVSSWTSSLMKVALEKAIEISIGKVYG